jgi:hypothetical protein
MDKKIIIIGAGPAVGSLQTTIERVSSKDRPPLFLCLTKQFFVFAFSEKLMYIAPMDSTVTVAKSVRKLNSRGRAT